MTVHLLYLIFMRRA